MRQIKFIIEHCTGGPQYQTVDAIKAYWRSKGWKVPGYHHLVEATGFVNDLLPIERVSNGVQGFNKHSINLCYIGGVDGKGRVFDNRTPEQKGALKMLTARYMEMFPSATVLGHRDFSPDKNRNGIIEEHEWVKACPSYSVREWLKEEGLVKNPIIPEVKKMVVTRSGNGVNIRKGPGVKFDKVASLEDGASCLVLANNGTWSQIMVSDTLQGWVLNDFLK